MPKTAIYTHADCLAHNQGEGHPESPARLSRILSAIEGEFPRSGGRVAWKDAAMGTEQQVLYCHAPEYLARLREKDAALAPGSALARLDEDTMMSPGSLKAALRGVGAVCQAVDDICAGEVERAFCAVRPPGHHALQGASMGFCLFGNVAIAAHHALTKPGIKRVAIVDFDVHHGNGTQDLVQGNPNILFFSTHQSPFWPFMGAAEERGPHDTIRNFPVPAAADPQVHRDIFSKKIVPELLAFKPDFVFLSAGFDAHRDDPLGGQRLTEEDFNWMAGQLLDVAKKCSQGRFLSVLEGGYNIRALANCALEHVKVLAGGNVS